MHGSRELLKQGDQTIANGQKSTRRKLFLMKPDMIPYAVSQQACTLFFLVKVKWAWSIITSLRAHKLFVIVFAKSGSIWPNSFWIGCTYWSWPSIRTINTKYTESANTCLIHLATVSLETALYYLLKLIKSCVSFPRRGSVTAKYFCRFKCKYIPVYREHKP